MPIVWWYLKHWPYKFYTLFTSFIELNGLVSEFLVQVCLLREYWSRPRSSHEAGGSACWNSYHTVDQMVKVGKKNEDLPSIGSEDIDDVIGSRKFFTGWPKKFIHFFTFFPCQKLGSTIFLRFNRDTPLMLVRFLSIGLYIRFIP